MATVVAGHHSPTGDTPKWLQKIKIFKSNTDPNPKFCRPIVRLFFVQMTVA